MSLDADTWLNDLKKLTLNIPASNIHRDQINILLCGPQGHGKSSTGNSILGFSEFAVSSETTKFELKSTMYENYKLKVVDSPPTPKERPNNLRKVLNSFGLTMKKLLQLCPKGFHAILIVLQYRSVFSEDQESLMFMLKEMYGEKFIQDHCICVISHGDLFNKAMERKKSQGTALDFDTWCSKEDQNSILGEIYRACKYKCVLFDNVTNDINTKMAQVHKLMSMIVGPWVDTSSLSLVSVNPNMRVKADIHILIETPPRFDEYQSQLKFAVNYTSNYIISPDAARACVMIFGQNDHMRYDFSKLNTHQQLAKTLFRAPFLNLSCGTERALMLARQESFSPSGGTRDGVKQMVVMVTEGRTPDESKTIEEADQLKSLGAEIIVIGVSRVNRTTLTAVASDPTHVFISDTYDELQELPKEIALKTAEKAPQFKTTADILFILDSSGSILPADYQKQLDFVVYVTGNFNIGPSDVLFSVMLFACNPVMLFDFHLSSHDEVKRKIKAGTINTLYLGGLTNTAAALDLARTDAFTSRCGCRGGKKIAIIITDGFSNNIHQTARAAEQLRESGVLTLAVGVGFSLSTELAHISTLPEEVYSVDNYNVLQTIHDELSEKTCKLETAKRDTVMRPPLPPIVMENTAMIPPFLSNVMGNTAMIPPFLSNVMGNTAMSPPLLSNVRRNTAMSPPLLSNVMRKTIRAKRNTVIRPAGPPNVLGNTVMIPPVPPNAMGNTVIRTPLPPNVIENTVIRPPLPPNVMRNTAMKPPLPPKPSALQRR